MKASIVLVSFLGLVSGMVLPGIRLSPSGAKPQSRSLFRRDDKLDYRYAPQVCCLVMIPSSQDELGLTQPFFRTRRAVPSSPHAESRQTAARE